MNKEERNRVQRLWYERNKEMRLLQIKARVSKNRQYVIDYKTDHSTCTDCGIDYPWYSLDFDHLPEFKKSFPLSVAGSKGRSIDSINKEIAKCEIVCANCHRHRTAMRKAKSRNELSSM